MPKASTAIRTLCCTLVAFGMFGAALAQDSTPDVSAYIDGLRRTRDSLLSTTDYAAALEPAQLLISELRLADQNATAERIVLAGILAELGRNDEAELEFLDVVQALEADEGLYTESLITPLRLLGRSYIQARQFPEAVAALSQARTVSRRTQGLFNVESQIGIIDDLTNARLGEGDTIGALELQLERLETAQRSFGSDDPQVIEYHYHLADYYEDSRQRESARDQFEDALQIAQLHADTRQMLIAASNIVRQDLQLAVEHRGALEQLRSLVDSPLAAEHPAASGQAHAVLGDVALVDEEFGDAREHYARAWALYEAAEDVNPASLFANPRVIRFIPPLSQVDLGLRSLPWTWGSIALDFDVDTNGRVDTVNGVASQPSALMDEAYVERVSTALFRPALSAAQPVAAEGVVLTHYFRYYVEEDED